jgi:hypothetical protein
MNTEVEKSMENEEIIEELTELNIIPTEDLSKCLNINNCVITYGLFSDKVYINLTELCHAGGKRYNDWRSLIATEQFLEQLKKETGISVSNFIYQVKGRNRNQATWGHPQIAIDIAYWVSPTFRATITKWIYELGLMGKVSLANQKTTAELDAITLERFKRLELDYRKAKSTLNKMNETSFGICFHQLENSEENEKCLQRDMDKLKEQLANAQNQMYNMQSELNIFRAEAKSDLYEAFRDKSRNRSYMAWVLMRKFLTPIYVKKVSVTDILKRFPKETTQGFDDWYKFHNSRDLNSSLSILNLNSMAEPNFYKNKKSSSVKKCKSRKIRNSKKSKSAQKNTSEKNKIDKKCSAEDDHHTGLTTSEDEVTIICKRPSTPKKQSRARKYKLSDSEEDEDSPEEELSQNESDESDNDLDIHIGDTYHIYKSRTDSNKKGFYNITTIHKKKTRYAAILYGDLSCLRRLISYFKSYDVYHTPDPEVFWTSISTIDACLRKLYINI